MNYCPKTDGNLAALAVYEREQAKLDISEREFERAKVSALLRILTRDQGAANDYTGLELVAESLSEHTTNVWRPVVSLLAEAAGELDSLDDMRSEEHTSELQSLMRISYAAFCLKKKNKKTYPDKT